MSSFVSPLQLRSFQILKLHFEVAEGGTPDLECEQGADLDFDLRFRDDSQSDCLLVLKHSINEQDVDFHRCGFRVSAEVGGVFDLEVLKTEYPETSEWTGFLLINGLSMLYTMLRQIVLQVSSVSPTSGILLPTVNMQEFLRLYAEEQAASHLDVDTES